MWGANHALALFHTRFGDCGFRVEFSQYIVTCKPDNGVGVFETFNQRGNGGICVAAKRPESIDDSEPDERIRIMEQLHQRRHNRFGFSMDLAERPDRIPAYGAVHAGQPG